MSAALSSPLDADTIIGTGSRSGPTSYRQDSPDGFTASPTVSSILPFGLLSGTMMLMRGPRGAIFATGS